MFMYFAIHNTHAPIEAPQHQIDKYNNTNHYEGDIRKAVFAAMVSTTLPKHSGWGASPEKAALTKRLMIAVKKAEVMKPKIVEMRKEELRRKMGGGA